jgi:hypothetical protein
MASYYLFTIKKPELSVTENSGFFAMSLFCFPASKNFELLAFSLELYLSV